MRLVRRSRRRPDPPFHPAVEFDAEGNPIPPKPPLFKTVVVPLFSLVLISIFTASFVIRSNKIGYVPGRASDLSPRIKVTGQTDYPPNGKVLLATVGLTDRLTYFQAFRGWLDDDTDVFDYEEIYPTGRDKELKRAQVMMDDSKVVATLAALRALGQDGSGAGVRVVEVVKDTPAVGKLKVGDVITRVESRDICISSDLRGGIKEVPLGQPVTLTVLRGSDKRTEIIKLVPQEDQGFRYIGVAVETVKCTLPVQVNIDTDNIGGPSAGLSMTLAILDRLTEGELTGGLTIAATGTIDGDGSVGDVGGVKQKTAGVIASGAKLFLVPPGEENDARARAGKLPVVAVSNLSEALAALRQYGGQPLPSPRATP